MKLLRSLRNFLEVAFIVLGILAFLLIIVQSAFPTPTLKLEDDEIPIIKLSELKILPDHREEEYQPPQPKPIKVKRCSSSPSLGSTPENKQPAKSVKGGKSERTKITGLDRKMATQKAHRGNTKRTRANSTTKVHSKP